MNKLKLYGFNNLTKSLSFCIYNVCYALTEEDRQSYIRYIDGQYNAKRLTQLLTEVCSMIGANILNIANQDYDPQGASVTILVSEEPIDPSCVDKSEFPGPAHECPYNECPHLVKQNEQCSQAVVAHLDKSHICVHTYPESNPQSGICTFRVDIEVSTCGVISPLKALNYLIHQLESDIVTIDYRVRGFTRDVNGTKHYIDHEISSIQNFLSNDIREQYEMLDVNMPQENIFHTKMRLTHFELEDFLFNIDPDSLSTAEHTNITQRLKQEMQEIYSGRNLS